MRSCENMPGAVPKRPSTGGWRIRAFQRGSDRPAIAGARNQKARPWCFGDLPSIAASFPMRFARLAMPSSLPPATRISAPSPHTFQRRCDAQLVLAAMASGEDQRGVVAVAFADRRDGMALALQGKVVRPEPWTSDRLALNPSGVRKPGRAPRNSALAPAGGASTSPAMKGWNNVLVKSLFK